MKKNGFTLVELMIVIAIIGILAAILIPPLLGRHSSNVTYSVTGGMIESRCIEGFKYTVTKDGARQVMDEYGKGVRCTQ